MDKIVEASLPPAEGSILGIKQYTQRQAEKFTEAFLRTNVAQKSQQQIDEVLQGHKAVGLHYAKQNCRTKAKAENRRKSKKPKGLNARQRREMGVFTLKPEHQKYKLFLPLHDLWKQYITDLCQGFKSDSNPKIIQQKFLKADLHGAIMTVVRSKCPSYVGTTGILIQELKHVFKIITEEDRLKVIPKRNSVFAVEVNGFVSNIYGSKFELRSSQRSAKKFKVKGTIDL